MLLARKSTVKPATTIPISKAEYRGLIRVIIILHLLGLNIVGKDVTVAYAGEDAGRIVRNDVTNTGGSGEKGSGSFGFQIGYYDNGDDGRDGNPFLDEDLTVVEPVIIFDYNVTDDVAAWGKFSYDQVSSASIDRLSRFPQQSGASGDYYYGLEGGVKAKLSDRTRVGGFGSISTEYDYNSIGFGGDIARDSADKNRTVKWGVNGFYDEIDIIRFNGTQNEGTDERLTLSTSLNWYQVIDPRTHGELGATLTHQWGFLETAFNSVIIEHPLGFIITEVQEELPDDRTRAAVYGRIRRHFPTNTAVELRGRLYADSWGISSFTAEPAVHQWIVEETLNMRFGYRFYAQSGADDFDREFFAIPKFRTQDSDLASFHSHGVGLQLNWLLSDTLTWNVAGDIIYRSDGINQLIGSMGLRREFQ